MAPSSYPLQTSWYVTVILADLALLAAARWVPGSLREAFDRKGVRKFI